jgi:methylthioribose-1-phosphate isomerase
MNDDPVPVEADGARYRSIRRPAGARYIEVLDQRALPHAIETRRIASVDAAAAAIRDMVVRGAPLIGAVGAYGFALGVDAQADDDALARIHALLDATRPTAVNLRWALDRVRARVCRLPPALRADDAWAEADAIVAEDLSINAALGRHGLELLRSVARERDRPLNVMTHCNAGALATCGFGTATAPIFLAHEERMPVHVWVSETRPRLQGANLTAWEMAQRDVPHTLIVDSASGLLMRRGEVDVVIVGADRVAANGDVCNKIGTYDKALAAADNGVPFYVALPSPTIDWTARSGEAITIETRSAGEVLEVHGRDASGRSQAVAIAGTATRAVNFAFDVTPRRLITGYLTERGVAHGAEGLRALFPEHASR